MIRVMQHHSIGVFSNFVLRLCRTLWYLQHCHSNVEVPDYNNSVSDSYPTGIPCITHSGQGNSFIK